MSSRNSSSAPSLVAMVGVLVLVSGPVGAQPNWEEIEFEATPVAGNVHVLVSGYGGNIGVSAGEDGVLIVDDQFAPLAEKIRAAIREIRDAEVAFLLNTHFHGDHTGGNVEFGPAATIIAHTNVRHRLATPQTSFGRVRDPLPPHGLPVITFEESLSIHFNGEEIRALHLPSSHTDGDLVVHFTRSNVVHMGDTFWNGKFPFVDLEHGGNVQGLTANMGHLLDRLPADVKLIPGHGEVGGVAEMREFHRMLVETTAFVGREMSRGRTLEEIREAGLPAAWDGWGDGFISEERWIETVHASLRE